MQQAALQAAEAAQSAGGVQLPPGPLTYSDLSWQDGRATIPKGRLADWLAGESIRGSCSFTKHGERHGMPPEDRKRGVRSDSKTWRAQFMCSFGPKDLRHAARPAGQLLKRRSKIEHGESIKRGCQYRFVVSESELRPGELEIRMLQHQHAKVPGGMPVHGPGADVGNPRLQQTPRLSASYKQWVSSKCAEGVSAESIIKQTQEQIVAAMQQEFQGRVV